MKASTPIWDTDAPNHESSNSFTPLYQPATDISAAGIPALHDGANTLAIAVYNNDNAQVPLTNAGVCMANKPDYDMAEKYFREALEFKSSYGEALIQLSSLKHKTGNDLHARAFLQRYLISNDPTPAALFLGIQIETKLGDDRAATDYSNQLLRDYPDSNEAKFILKNR